MLAGSADDIAVIDDEIVVTVGVDNVDGFSVSKLETHPTSNNKLTNQVTFISFDFISR